jgi:hypothetical protein
MSRLAQAGLSSTASPPRARPKHQRVAASSDAWRSSGTPVGGEPVQPAHPLHPHREGVEVDLNDVP